MKLTTANKENLLATASQVYNGYVGIDFFKNRILNSDLGDKSLLQLCAEAVPDKPDKLDQEITIEGIVYQLQLTPRSNGYDVSFKRPIHNAARAVTKKIGEYSDQEALDLLSQQQFHITMLEDRTFAVSNTISEHNVIGGAGKIDLYRSHLVTLHNIIEKIDSEEDISNLLVALATGSGKTYVQALWMYVLSLSGNTGIFAVPDRLVSQFHKDLKRLLPDEFLQDVLMLRENQDSPEAEEALANLGQEPKIIIASSERLLDSHYQELLQADPEQVFLSFDEQHLLMKSEIRRVRLIELSKQMLSMFLTATPQRETYELCGNRPVAIMSSGQKQQAGQGQFPELFTNHGRNISDKNKLKTYRFWTGEFWQNMFNGLLLRFTNAIQEEQSSAAVSIVDDLPFYMHRKPEEVNPRWSLQVPMSRKMLVIVDDNETLVNFCNALQHGNRNVYRDGNVVDRRDVANFFQLPDSDNDIISRDLAARRAQYRESLSDAERPLIENLANKSLQKQLSDNILHNLIEYVLSDLTGMDQIEHNCLRKEDPNAFRELVLSKQVRRDANYFRQKLEREIDAAGAAQLSTLLAGLSSILNTTRRPSQELNAFVDNWALNDHFTTQLLRDNWRFSNDFSQYVEDHLVIGVMAGMKDAETPVAESAPFLGMTKSTYQLYDHNGALVENAKKRQHTSLEILNDTARESRFTPNYMNVSEEICDNYFRLGFVGAYVSNKKTEGFSDRNLHTVVNLGERSLGKTNSPDKLIQGIGRNRGLDETIVPSYIHALGRKQKPVFDLRHLNRDDYYPELFKAQDSYNHQYIAILGQEVGKDIMAWYTANLNKDETIDADKLKRQVLKFIAKALRTLNNQNSHNIQLSRAQLTKVVAAAMSALNDEINQIKKPYKLSIFVRVLGTFLNFMCECYYTVKRIPVALKLYRHWLFADRAPENEQGESTTDADNVYMKIIRNASYKSLVSNSMVAKEFMSWITRRVKVGKEVVTTNTDQYLTDEFQSELEEQLQNSIFPMIEKMVTPEKVAIVREALNSIPNYIPFFNQNKDLVTTLLSGTAENQNANILKFLHAIPGLQTLTLAHVVDHHKKVMNNVASIANPAQFIADNAALKAELVHSLSDYMQGGFLTHLMALVTYPDLLLMRQALTDRNKTEAFVAQLLTQAGKNSLSVEKVFAEFKRFFELPQIDTLDKKGALLAKKLNEVQAAASGGGGILASLAALASVPLKLSTIMQSDLLPLLAAFIKDEDKKQAFLAFKNAPLSFTFIKQNQALLQELAQENGEARTAVALQLINKWIPVGQSLTPEDMVETESHALKHANGLAEDAKLLTIQTFLASDEFIKMLADFFNDEDYQCLLDTLDNEDMIEYIAQQIAALPPGELNLKSVMAIIKASDERLADIQTLDARMQDVQEFFTAVANTDKSLDKDKLARLAIDTLAPVILHPKFIPTINNLIGFLDTADIAQMLKAKNIQNPDETAAQLTEFLTVLNKKDVHALHSLRFPNGNLENLLDNLTKLIEEVFDCHCYYNQHDKKGQVTYGIEPALLAKLSDHVRSTRIDASYSFFSQFSRKIFFIQGIRNGLPESGRINADSNTHKVKVLERVRAHLLRPLWWSVNVSNFTHGFIQLCRDGVDWMASVGYSVLNGLKSAANFVVGDSHYFRTSAKNEDSRDYNDTAFDYAQAVNQLNPFTHEDVAEDDCAADVVTYVEEFIASRPQRFFAHPSTVVDNATSVDSDDSDVDFEPDEHDGLGLREGLQV